MRKLSLGLLCAPVLLSASLFANAAQHGLVVGINDYQYGSSQVSVDRIQNLRGAENDALRISQALHSIDVELPESNILIGADATLEAFKTAWLDTLARSRPGDTLIITFAGHGGQEREVIPPIDEQSSDGFDETLMFWDFDPVHPYRGRLVDDELYQMFKSASDRQIIFVADSCHSGGLTRSMDSSGGDARRTRSWEFPDDSLDDLLSLEAAEGEDWESLSNVTYLTGTDSEEVLVNEILVDGKFHGALSLGFAQGIEGRADTNGDGRVLRRELQDYVQAHVRTLSDFKQTPGFAPRSGSLAEQPLIDLPDNRVNAVVQVSYDALSAPLPVQVLEGEMPDSISGAIQTESAALKFRRVSGEVIAYFQTDELLRWSDSDGTPNRERWQRLIDKFRFLRGMDAAINPQQPYISLTVSCDNRHVDGHCDGEHRLKEKLAFEFNHLREGSGKYFVLFNLSGDGQFQMLYPTRKTDIAELRKLPYSLDLEVTIPVGRDDLVALFCREDPVLLKRLLAQSDGGNAPGSVEVVSEMRKAQCQVERTAVFTGV